MQACSKCITFYVKFKCIDIILNNYTFYTVLISWNGLIALVSLEWFIELTVVLIPGTFIYDICYSPHMKSIVILQKNAFHNTINLFSILQQTININMKIKEKIEPRVGLTYFKLFVLVIILIIARHEIIQSKYWIILNAKVSYLVILHDNKTNCTNSISDICLKSIGFLTVFSSLFNKFSSIKSHIMFILLYEVLIHNVLMKFFPKSKYWRYLKINAFIK